MTAPGQANDADAGRVIDAAVEEFQRWRTSYNPRAREGRKHMVLRKDEFASDLISSHATGDAAQTACVREALAAVLAAHHPAREAADGWMPIESAPKDGTSVLLLFKNPIPDERKHVRIWDGLMFIGRHPGVCDDGFDMGWDFAAPVGHGGFPDKWFAGWCPLPSPPPPSTEQGESQ